MSEKDRKRNNAAVSSNEEEMDEDDEPTILELQTTDGKIERFELLDLVNYNDEDYIVIAPEKQGDVDFVEIYRVEEDPEDPEMENYMGLESQEEVDAVYEIFKERNKDLFDWAD